MAYRTRISIIVYNSAISADMENTYIFIFLNKLNISDAKDAYALTTLLNNFA